MLDNFIQLCSRVGHIGQIICGICVNIDCNEVPTSCQICNQKYHSSHQNDVITNHQVRKYLTDMDSKLDTIIKQYDDIIQKINKKIKTYVNDIVIMRDKLQDLIKKDIEREPNSQLHQISNFIKELKTFNPIQQDVFLQNQDKLKQLYKQLNEVDEIYAFRFEQGQNLDLNQERTIVKCNQQTQQQIYVQPNIDDIELKSFKFILNLVDLKSKFCIVLYSRVYQDQIFSIDQKGYLTDNMNSFKICESIKSEAILSLYFNKIKQNVIIDIQQEQNASYTYQFQEKVSLMLRIFLDQGQLQILHEI
ncbi:hypothetical protein pb186bvf_007420 [Paramecium bursaria]